jgi:uncharacterized protein (DUF488 family)
MNPMDTELSVWTIGHLTRPIDEFVATLKSFGIGALVDVRTALPAIQQTEPCNSPPRALYELNSEI